MKNMIKRFFNSRNYSINVTEIDGVACCENNHFSITHDDDLICFVGKDSYNKEIRYETDVNPVNLYEMIILGFELTMENESD